MPGQGTTNSSRFRFSHPTAPSKIESTCQPQHQHQHHDGFGGPRSPHSWSVSTALGPTRGNHRRRPRTPPSLHLVTRPRPVEQPLLNVLNGWRRHPRGGCAYIGGPLQLPDPGHVDVARQGFGMPCPLCAALLCSPPSPRLKPRANPDVSDVERRPAPRPQIQA